MSRDPVYQNDNGSWYFYDELWADELGPFGSEVEAREALAKYVESL